MTTFTLPTKSYNYSNISLTSGGSGGTIPVTTSSTWGATSYTIAPDTINKSAIVVKGDAIFEGNITWQDRDMREWFQTVESRLAMLEPNPRLEEDYEELKKLGDQYRTLEKRLMEQQRIFDILKKSD